jgi:hypothetical protein
MTVRRLALRIFQLAVSIGLLAYLVITIPMRDVFAALISARLDWLFSGFALVGAINLLAALQMRAIGGSGNGLLGAADRQRQPRRELLRTVSAELSGGRRDPLAPLLQAGR